MCLLCVVQRWSRRVAAMLPWLVVPLLVLWILSQLLPPNLRFEITSPRLACVIVLLVTLFWYEILMPKLSIWRARRSAMLRERRRTQAIELQKLRRSATRRCRNCLTPYREQNPCGGKFMCSYCGHISKRPVLDLSGWPDWSGECGGPGDARCLTEKSYSGAYRAAYSVIFSAGFCIGWVVGKVFRIGHREGGSDGENTRLLSGKRGDSGGSFQESRGEKTRRKAEEKRQARLEREMLEAEERKQREEVARLVEERRRLRDEMLEAERGRMKSSSNSETSRKETERRKKERRRGEKEKGSSKSNSDGEEQERRRMSREGEKKQEFDKKGEMERQKALVETVRSQVSDAAHGNKASVSKTRYFDRVKGTFLSSSRGFNGSFFRRNAQCAVAPASKATKPASGFVDHGHNAGMKRDTRSTASMTGKSTVNGDPRHAGIGLQPRVPAPKKGWHQLFACSSSVSPDPDTNTTSFVNLNGHVEDTSAIDKKVLPYTVDSGFDFGQSLPLSCYSSPNVSSNGRSFSPIGADSLLPPMKEPKGLEDAELFEDPCYVPDSVSLLGPVSESLDKFPLDLGIGFIEHNLVEAPRVLKNVTALPEPKPSPIESPLTKSLVSEERQSSYTPKTPNLHALDFNGSSNAQTWQMWGNPSAHEGLGLEGGPSNWFSALVQNTANQNVNHPLAQGPILPQIGKYSHSLPSIRTRKNCGNNNHGGKFSPLGPVLNGNDQWVCNSPMKSILPVDRESHFLPLDLIDNMARNEAEAYSSPKSSAPTYPVEVLPANGWFKEEWALPSMKEAAVRPPNIGGLFSTSPDVQSVWSYYNHQ